jgi:hypothetical protein
VNEYAILSGRNKQRGYSPHDTSYQIGLLIAENFQRQAVSPWLLSIWYHYTMKAGL